MKNRLPFFVFTTCISTLMFFAREAPADMAPWAAIESLMQEGQDVKITVGSYGTSLNDIDMSVERVQGDKTVVLGNGLIFSDENMVSSVFWCDDYYMWESSIKADEFCETYPAVCLSCPGKEDEICVGSDCSDCTVVEDNTLYPESVPYENSFCDSYPAYWKDCNLDGTQDCCLGCNLNYDYTYEFIDECVPPGSTQYILGGWPVEDGSDYGAEYKIDVVDAGTECDPTSTDNTEDTETDTTEIEIETETATEMETETETETVTETETETETVFHSDTETATESDEEQATETETPAQDDTETVEPLPEDSDSELVIDTEDPTSTDTAEETDIADTVADTATEDEPKDTEEKTSSAEKNSSGCQVSGAGALSESAVWQLIVSLF